MSAPAFTAGPWDYEPALDGFAVVRIAPAHGLNGGNIIGQFHGADRAANAALCRAAPDLYAALGAIINNTDFGAIQPRYVEAARAAMLKARGEN